MKYYYLEGIDKLGPYSLEEILYRNLSSNTMILREDKINWAALSEFQELSVSQSEVGNNTENEVIRNEKINDSKNQVVKIETKKSKKILYGILAIVLLFFSCYFVYNHFALNENIVRETSKRFFNMLIMDNLSSKDFEELYPNMNEIGNRVVFKKECVINSISKNSDGDYEVFASYQINNFNIKPVYLIIGRENNKTIIKSSKGINYAYYDRVLEYGKKIGCLTGIEADVEMGKIIQSKKLRVNLEMEARLKIRDLYNNLKISDDIKVVFGSISGNVTITNNNDIDFGHFDIDCSVEFYNRNGQINSSEKVYLYNGIKAHGSSSGSVFSTSQNSSKYKINVVINNSDDIINKIKDRIIEETQFGCY
jgi:hypothetical protein